MPGVVQDYLCAFARVAEVLQLVFGVALHAAVAIFPVAAAPDLGALFAAALVVAIPLVADPAAVAAGRIEPAAGVVAAAVEPAAEADAAAELQRQHAAGEAVAAAAWNSPSLLKILMAQTS